MVTAIIFFIRHSGMLVAGGKRRLRSIQFCGTGPPLRTCRGDGDVIKFMIDIDLSRTNKELRRLGKLR